MSEQQEKKPNIFLRLLAFLVTLALILGALALVVYRDRLNLDAVKRWLSFRKVETGDTGEAAPFTHAGGDKLSVEYLEDGVVMTSTSGVHYYSFSGEPYAEEVVTMENPVLCAGSRAAVAYDVGGQSLFVLRGESETMDLSLDSGELLSARVNDSGYLAVTAQQSGYKGAVTLYNAGGEKVIQINLSSTFLVDAAPSPDGRMVAAVAMDSDGGSFRSRVLFYQVNQKEPSLEVSLGGSSVLDMRYTDSGLWVLGESSLMIVSPKDGSVQTYSFGRSYLKGCDLSGDGFALVLLDLMLPGLTGEEFIAKVRQHGTMPIIVLSAKAGVEDRVKVLRLGADDFIPKPFDNQEVLARVEAQLRRVKKFSAPPEKKQRFVCGDLCLDREEFTVTAEGNPVTLTAREFEILALLMEYPKRVFTREQIYQHVWGEDYFGDDNTVNVHISNLRSKLGKVSKQEFIKTVWGIGFKMADC